MKLQNDIITIAHPIQPPKSHSIADDKLKFINGIAIEGFDSQHFRNSQSATRQDKDYQT